jgi:tRNA-dihydrouridine synthase 4
MAARGLLENPALFLGHTATPAQCIEDWVRLALATGTQFACFHHHLIYMVGSSISRAERTCFNALTSTAAVVDYMRQHWGLMLEPPPRQLA